ncbi:hypothetical protein [Streptomyces sp. 8L]|uniref:hypothetical protein n=1 Tax=Streptomyces sp. 8L TaxID=2877242 RepID=UPI001CD71290|nr:hypothetical protein [Streptomyces sp. 8L]MCA1217403.1 hypothetical protein [Streptomyces sp. 8L]
MHEQLGQLGDGAPRTSNMTCDGGGNAVAVFGQTLPLFAQDDSPLTIELAVAACGITPSQVSEEDQIGRDPWELSEALSRGLGACDCLWLG